MLLPEKIQPGKKQPGKMQGKAAQGITAERVLGELAAIAFAQPEEDGAPAVKTADKLRALEMIYKHLGMAESADDEGVIIIDGDAPG